MMIQCPACATRYVVPDTAIGVEGRTVRCAKCRHSWFEDGHQLPQPAPVDAEEIEQPATEEDAAPDTTPPETPAPAIASPETPSAEVLHAEPEPIFSGDAPVPPPVATPVSKPRAPQSEVSQFDAAPPFRRRRNPLKLWSWASGIFALVAAGLILSVSFFGLPDWVPISRPTFAVGEPDLQLDFPPEQQERRQLPNGQEFFGASGAITNIGTTARRLPTLLIVLRDARERIVYSWEVPPPQSSIAPGESVTINEAVTDIPRSARFAEIGWKPD